MLFSYDGGLNLYNSQTITHHSMNLLMDLQSHRERDNVSTLVLIVPRITVSTTSGSLSHYIYCALRRGSSGEAGIASFISRRGAR